MYHKDGIVFSLSLFSRTVHVYHPKEDPASTRESHVFIREQSTSNYEVCVK